MSDAALILAGLAAVFVALHRERTGAAPASGPLTAERVRALAEDVRREHGLATGAVQATAIAKIESSFDPRAVRPEPDLPDASVGLMQTLAGTALWLAKDMGYTAFGQPRDKQAMIETLMQPKASLYFGMAYLDYLRTHPHNPGTEEWTVRSYNGGPGNLSDATADYWERYKQAKEAVT